MHFSSSSLTAASRSLLGDSALLSQFQPSLRKRFSRARLLVAATRHVVGPSASVDAFRDGDAVVVEVDAFRVDDLRGALVDDLRVDGGAPVVVVVVAATVVDDAFPLFAVLPLPPAFAARWAASPAFDDFREGDDVTAFTFAEEASPPTSLLLTTPAAASETRSRPLRIPSCVAFGISLAVEVTREMPVMVTICTSTAIAPSRTSWARSVMQFTRLGTSCMRSDLNTSPAVTHSETWRMNHSRSNLRPCVGCRVSAFEKYAHAAASATGSAVALSPPAGAIPTHALSAVCPAATTIGFVSTRVSRRSSSIIRLKRRRTCGSNADAKSAIVTAATVLTRGIASVTRAFKERHTFAAALLRTIEGFALRIFCSASRPFTRSFHAFFPALSPISSSSFPRPFTVARSTAAATQSEASGSEVNAATAAVSNPTSSNFFDAVFMNPAPVSAPLSSASMGFGPILWKTTPRRLSAAFRSFGVLCPIPLSPTVYLTMNFRPTFAAPNSSTALHANVKNASSFDAARSFSKSPTATSTIRRTSLVRQSCRRRLCASAPSRLSPQFSTAGVIICRVTENAVRDFATAARTKIILFIKLKLRTLNFLKCAERRLTIGSAKTAAGPSPISTSCAAISSITAHLSCHDASAAASVFALTFHSATPRLASCSSASSTVDETTMPCGALDALAVDADADADADAAGEDADVGASVEDAVAAAATGAVVDDVFAAAAAGAADASAVVEEEEAVAIELLRRSAGAIIAATRSPHRVRDAFPSPLVETPSLLHMMVRPSAPAVRTSPSRASRDCSKTLRNTVKVSESAKTAGCAADPSATQRCIQSTIPRCTLGCFEFVAASSTFVERSSVKTRDFVSTSASRASPSALRTDALRSFMRLRIPTKIARAGWLKCRPSTPRVIAVSKCVAEIVTATLPSFTTIATSARTIESYSPSGSVGVLPTSVMTTFSASLRSLHFFAFSFSPNVVFCRLKMARIRS